VLCVIYKATFLIKSYFQRLENQAILNDLATALKIHLLVREH